jgi:hypothetical protein
MPACWPWWPRWAGWPCTMWPRGPVWTCVRWPRGWPRWPLPGCRWSSGLNATRRRCGSPWRGRAGKGSQHHPHRTAAGRHPPVTRPIPRGRRAARNQSSMACRGRRRIRCRWDRAGRCGCRPDRDQVRQRGPADRWPRGRPAPTRRRGRPPGTGRQGRQAGTGRQGRQAGTERQGHPPGTQRQGRQAGRA